MAKSIFPADDNAANRVLFEDALKEIYEKTRLTTAKNREDLKQQLHKRETVLNGMECLEELKGNKKFLRIPVRIFSTSANENAISSVFSYGANYHISKPDTVLFAQNSYGDSMFHKFGEKPYSATT